MSVAEFSLHHVDGAPLLEQDGAETMTRTLSESLELLDAEPVVVVNLLDTPFLDAETDRAILHRKLRAGSPLIVIVRAGSNAAAALRSLAGARDLVIVERLAEAAVHAARVRRRHRSRAEREPERPHRYRVRRSL
jgi:hypothetical protein